MELITQDEKITFGKGLFFKKKFIITADLPFELIDKITEYTKEEGDPKETYTKLKELVKDIFYLRNKKSKVDKFVDPLGMANISKIFMFLTEYIQGVTSNIKKKTDLKT